MQQWIDSLPNGSTAVLRSSGCYDVESDTLVIHDKTNFTLEGSGATIHRFRDPTAGLRQVQFVNATNVAVRDLTIVGNNSQHLGFQLGGHWEGQAGLGIAVNGAVVENVYVTDVFGDGINLSGGGTNIRVTNSHVGQAARQGIAITNASNVTIDHDTIDMAHRMGIDLEPYASTDRVTNVSITDNSICGNYGPIAGYSHWGVTNVVIRSNTYCWGGPIAF